MMRPLGVCLRRWKTVFALHCMASDAVVPDIPVQVMGLTFANPLGLAAGFDRSGTMIPQLRRTGLGHVEVGTITPGDWLGYSRLPAAGPCVGVNIGSRRYGLNEEVINDYIIALRAVFERAHYVVGNLSSPFLRRHADTQGVERLVASLNEAHKDCMAATARHVALLLKVHGGAEGAPIPLAVREGRRCGLDGVVLVSSSAERIAAFIALDSHLMDHRYQGLDG